MANGPTDLFLRLRRTLHFGPAAALAKWAVSCFLIVLFFALATPVIVRAQSTLPADENAMALPAYPAFFGDFDEMKKTRLIRILVPYSKTIYFLDKGAERGVAAELGRVFEAWLNKKYNMKSLKIRIAFVPTARDKLLPDLVAGRGDIVAANLTITPERRQTVDFSDPLLKNVKEVVVT